VLFLNSTTRTRRTDRFGLRQVRGLCLVGSGRVWSGPCQIPLHGPDPKRPDKVRGIRGRVDPADFVEDPGRARSVEYVHYETRVSALGQ